MGKKSRIALIGGLLLAGLALLIAGLAWMGRQGGLGTWSLTAGVLLLLGAAGLALQQRRRPQPRLVGEYRGVLASEAGFVPLRAAGEEERQQVQRRIVGQPEKAADSVRGLLLAQVRQAKGASPRKEKGQRGKKRG
jgi:uncharacterized membrane protein (UPF0136 family)